MKSATTSGVMYACGSPISYTSCSVTDGTLTAAAGVRVLRDDERAVGARLDDRIADVREVGNVPPVVEAVAARALRAALDDVAGDDSGGELVPVVAPQPNSWRSGAIVSAVSVERPVMTTFAPCASASTIGVGADVRVGREHAIANGRRAARRCPCSPARDRWRSARRAAAAGRRR